MSEAAAPSDSVCAQCGAQLPYDAQRCWLCDAPVSSSAPDLPGALPASVNAPSPYPPAPYRGGSFSLATLMIVTTLVAVCCGLFIVAPGLAVTLSIVLAPVLVRTAMVVRRREAAGSPVNMAQRAGLILGSLVVAHVILAVVLVAAVGTFCAVCLSAGTESAIPAALLIAAVPTVAVIWLMVRWVRARYRHAVEER